MLRSDLCDYADSKYEPYLCNSCHDLMEKAITFNNVPTVFIIWSNEWMQFHWMQFRWINLLSKKQKRDTK